jgi:signal transduction histidine kinase
MRLADFILANVEPILAEWEMFARSVWPGEATDPTTLRDHAEAVLRATASDMVSAQTDVQQSDKSKGDGLAGTDSDRVNAASTKHGFDRAASGFDLAELVAEYRALRASVFRLWRESKPSADGSDLEDLTRFNESIDQSLTAAVLSFTHEAKQCQGQLVAEQAARMGAETANRAKDNFLATLSHEMRTPLNAIVGWLSILSSKDCTSDDLHEGLDVIERNTNAQVRLIEDILDVSRIVSGKLRLETRSCGLAEIIDASVNAVRSDAEARGVALDVRLDPSARHAPCDPDRIQQVVWNLLSNAVKFTPKGGRISVTLKREQSSLQIEVSDNGQGISPELLPYIFDRFRQADDGTRRKSRGLGLGLSIVKHLVELHGGTVEAHSAGEGHGSTFTVRLPVHASAIAESRGGQLKRAGTDPALPDPPRVSLDGLQVLLVDDEPDALGLLAKLLQGVGAIVTTACSAREAIEALPAARPDVLVSDIGMPGQDGYDLIREVRRRGHHAKNLPAVAVTAFAQKEDQRQALLAGFQVHVPKPINVDDLTAIIASLAGRTG